ncbi:MAG TPA: recombination mediator RecR [Pyrinomonadaceae bacterium]|nr:recombination protein RecR [Chloracidobacterium sp.]MBP9108025.1 recombination protein RecR [Pyrinomonadaceae bacterium]MBK7801977.1 recombination protein RecR [Chloracidobacterium sp.]MBK9437879.1 recombination protein RecR [Chloracidobacterium sp.]MBL0242281.1 recombination protein RecR [Chloracidobacterium sp.]
MLDYSEPVAKLIDEFKRLPGVGQKSAQRLAFYILRRPMPEVEQFANALREVKEKIVFCSVCNNLTDVDPCLYCANPKRDRSIICIVEEPYNLVAVEKTRSFRGLYHIIHGSLSPLRGIGPDELMLANLIPRLRPENNEGVEIAEVIVATNPTTEGEATANYIARLLKPLGVRVTRIAMGMPVGADIEFVDEVTMDKALTNRHDM